MKHYSADLLNNNEVVTDGRLLIAEARTRVANAVTPFADFANLADTIDGFVINSGASTTTNILDAQGSQFDPNAGTAASRLAGTDGIIDIVRAASFDSGASILRLSFNSDATVGAAVAAGDGFNIDLSALSGGGGGAGAATNPTNHLLPVKTAHGTINTFIDSAFQSVAGDTAYANAINLTNAPVYTTGTSATFTAAAGLDTFDTGDEVIISNAGNGTTLAAFELSGTVAAGGTATSITITIAATSAELAALAADGTQVSLFGLTRDQNLSGGRVDGNLEVSGNLSVLGDTTILNVATINAEDKYLAVNATTNTADSVVTGATADGGLLVAKAQATAAQSSAGAITAGTGGEFAGIRFREYTVANEVGNMGIVGDGQWEISRGVPTAGGADANWVPISTGPATAVEKYAADHNLAASGTTITILESTHGLSGSDFTVTVYDLATSDVKTQIIPEEIQVGTNSSGTGAGLEGTVTITFPVLSTTAATTFRIVIKS